MNQEYLERLIQIGFTKNTATVYLFIHEHDAVRAGRIIKETELQRSVVYKALEELEERQLVVKTIRRGVATYFINEPRAIVDEITEKQNMALSLSNDLARERVRKERTAIVLEGDDIIQRIAEKSLSVKPGETVYFLAPSKFGHQAELESFWTLYHKKRIASNIACKILYDRSTDEKIVEHRNAMELCDAQYLPYGSEEPMWYIIAGGMVAMIVPAEDPLVAFMIQSQYTANALKEHFNYLWQSASENT